MSTALSPSDFLRSVSASRETLGRTRIDLLDVIAHVRTLTNNTQYCIVGGLAQILWARTTRAEELHVTLALEDVAVARFKSGAWESDDVIEVCHVLYDGSVVDMLAFKNAAFNAAILSEAVEVVEIGNLRVIRPEHLLVTHLLRPGPNGALAAVELVIARRGKGGFDEALAHDWAERVGRADRLARVLEQAKAFEIL